MKAIHKLDETHALTLSSEDRKVCVWDVKGNKMSSSYEVADSGPLCSKMASNGEIVVTADLNHIFVHDLVAGKQVLDF